MERQTKYSKYVKNVKSKNVKTKIVLPVPCFI